MCRSFMQLTMANSTFQSDSGQFRFKKNRPHFFKIILKETIDDGKLRIPGKLVKRYGDDLANVIILKAPTGEQWKVELVKTHDDGQCWLQNGFTEFAENYSLSAGSLLVFECESSSLFHVLIFDKTALEIDYPFSTIDADEKPPVEEEFQEQRMEEFQEQRMEEFQERRMEKSSEEDIMEADLNPSSKTEEKLLLPGPLPPKKIRIDLTSEFDGSIKWQTSTVSTGDESVRMKKNKSQLPCSHHPTQQIGGGERDISIPKQRLNGVTKRTKPLTADEKDNVLRIANAAVKPKNPFFTVAMQPTYIHHGNSFSIPYNFAKTYFKEKRGSVILRISDGRTWTAKYMIELFNKKRRARFEHCCWRTFMLDNNLEVGDVCVFELTKETKISLQVAIYRATEFVNGSLSLTDARGADQVGPNESLVDKTESDGNRVDAVIPCDENITGEAGMTGANQVRPNKSLVDESDGNSHNEAQKSCPCDETIAGEADMRGAHQAKPNKSLFDKTESDGNRMDEAIPCDENITGEADMRGAHQAKPNKSLVDKTEYDGNRMDEDIPCHENITGEADLRGANQARPNKSLVDKSDGNSSNKTRKSCPCDETIAGEADMRGTHQAKPNKSLVDKTESDGNRMDRAIPCDENITGEAYVRGANQEVRPNKSFVDKSCPCNETIAGEADMRGARQARPNKSLVDKTESDGNRMDEAIPSDENLTGEADVRGANQIRPNKSFVDKSEGNSPDEARNSCPCDETIAGEAEMIGSPQAKPNKRFVDKTESDGNRMDEATISIPCDENITGEWDVRRGNQVRPNKSSVDKSDEARKSCPCDQTIAGEADMRGDHQAKTNKSSVDKTESDGNSIVEARISIPCDETIVAEADVREANQLRPNKSLVDKTESGGNSMDEARISSSYEENRKGQPQLSESEFKTEPGKFKKSEAENVPGRLVAGGFEAESNFTSTYPFFKVVLRSCYSENYSVPLPFSFIERHFKDKVQTVTLQVADGSWPVKLISYSSFRIGSLSNGWAKFAAENSLQAGDVCAFELIKSDILKVSVFRNGICLVL